MNFIYVSDTQDINILGIRNQQIFYFKLKCLAWAHPLQTPQLKSLYTKSHFLDIIICVWTNKIFTIPIVV